MILKITEAFGGFVLEPEDTGSILMMPKYFSKYTAEGINYILPHYVFLSYAIQHHIDTVQNLSVESRCILYDLDAVSKLDFNHL